MKLQSDYGQAMMWSKGYAAEETRAAFARAAELTGGAENAAERLRLSRRGGCEASCGGELRKARETAETFLARSRGGRVRHGSRRRPTWSRLTCFYHGDLPEARSYLERALADYGPDRDAKARFHFGWTPEVVTLRILALRCGNWVRWSAPAVGDRAVQSAAELGHAPHQRIPSFGDVSLEVGRDDRRRGAERGRELDALGREHGMDHFVAYGGICMRLGARSTLATPEAGARSFGGRWRTTSIKAIISRAMVSSGCLPSSRR